MKNIALFFAFAFGSLFFAQRSEAQCYVRLDDASGFNTDAYQDTLEAAAAKLCAIFDSTGFADEFKVYDFGFYLHQENTTGGYPEPFAQKIAEVQALSPYYLLFGKQTDKNGVYTKFWVMLKMPDTAQFSCMTEIQRAVYSKRVEKKTIDKYAEKSNNHDAFNEAELAGIDEFYKILKEIKECCLYRNGNRMMGCNGCSDEILNTYFDLSEFKKINLATSLTTFANIKKYSIRDYSFHKITLNNQEDYVGNHLDSLVRYFNKWLSFNLLVTSTQSLCIDSILGDNVNRFKTEKEFFCQLNLSSAPNENSRIDIKWNKKANSWINNSEIANLIIDVLSCKINRALNINDEDCFSYLNVSPWKANMDDFPDFDLFYAIYIQNLNIGVSIDDLIDSYSYYNCDDAIGMGNYWGATHVPHPPAEINNGIEILSTWNDAYLLTGHLIASTDYRHPFPADDMTSETNGNCTGVINKCMTEKYLPPVPPSEIGHTIAITESNRISKMYDLIDFHSKGTLKPVGQSFVDRFLGNHGNLQNDDQYNNDAMFNDELSNVVRLTPEMRNFMKEFGLRLNIALSQNGGDINSVSIINMTTTHPSFRSTDHICNGLTILINDTEQTLDWYDKGFQYDSSTKIWSGDFFFEVTDHFGLDYHDVITFQNQPISGEGFAAWWVLQHRDGYRPFKTKITMYAKLQGHATP